MIWKPTDVQGYSVSACGKVRSDKRGTLMKLSLSRVGNYGGAYLVVNLGRGNKRYVHRLVATAFCENEGQHGYINHIDENKLNNSADNLEWCSNQHNIRHSMAKACVLRSPTGERVEVACMSDFCRDNGLNSGGLSMMVAGKYKHHHGWTLWK